MNSKIRAIARRIKEHKTIVIARHIGPDPDAVASQVAFRDAIKLRYPSKEVYAVGSPVAKFRYLGKLDKLPESTNLEDALLIVLDCPNVSRIDEADVTKFDEVIKIDHHLCSFLYKVYNHYLIFDVFLFPFLLKLIYQLLNYKRN